MQLVADAPPSADAVRAWQPETAVAIRGVEKRFDNGTQALAPIDLDIAQGEFVTLIGPSGCGKSTLLNLIAHLTSPTSGSIVKSGASRTGGEGKIAFVFQDPTLMPWARVEKNVRLPLDLAGVAKSASQPIVADALARVGLADFARSYPRELSGGMRMRVSLARALVTVPDLLLMDEPFGALDEFTRNKLDADLVSLWSERRFTTIFVTHSIYEAVFLSTRILVMAPRPGRIFREMHLDATQPRDAAFRSSKHFIDACSELTRWLAEASMTAGGST